MRRNFVYKNGRARAGAGLYVNVWFSGAMGEGGGWGGSFFFSFFTPPVNGFSRKSAYIRRNIYTRRTDNTVIVRDASMSRNDNIMRVRINIIHGGDFAQITRRLWPVSVLKRTRRRGRDRDAIYNS